MTTIKLPVVLDHDGFGHYYFRDADNNVVPFDTIAAALNGGVSASDRARLALNISIYFSKLIREMGTALYPDKPITGAGERRMAEAHESVIRELIEETLASPTKERGEAKHSPTKDSIKDVLDDMINNFATPPNADARTKAKTILAEICGTDTDEAKSENNIALVAGIIAGPGSNLDARVAALRKAHNEALAPLARMLELHNDFSKAKAKTQPSHLRWMIYEIKTNGAKMPLDKIARWTGFVQGVMATRGWINVEAERERTRPIFAAALSPSSSTEPGGNNG